MAIYVFIKQWSNEPQLFFAIAAMGAVILRSAYMWMGEGHSQGEAQIFVLSNTSRIRLF